MFLSSHIGKTDPSAEEQDSFDSAQNSVNGSNSPSLWSGGGLFGSGRAPEENNETIERSQRNDKFFGNKAENGIEYQRQSLNSPRESKGSTPEIRRFKKRAALFSSSPSSGNQTPTRSSSIQSGLKEIHDLLGSISNESMEDYVENLYSDSSFVVRDQQIKKQKEARELEEVDNKLKDLNIQRDERVQGYIEHIEAEKLRKDLKLVKEERVKQERLLATKISERETLRKILEKEQADIQNMEDEIIKIGLQIEQYHQQKIANIERRTELERQKLEELKRLEQMRKETELAAKEQAAESKRQEEERKIREAETLAQAKQLAETKAKKEAEEKAKKEAEEKAKKEAEEKANIEKKKKASDNSDIVKEYLKYKNMIEQIKVEVNEPVSKNPAYKQQCQQIKRHIRPKLGQLTDSTEKLVTIYRDILSAVQSCRNVPQVFLWVLNFYSKALIDQAEAEVSVSINRAQPLAILTASLLAHIPELYDYLVARFVKKCPMLIGYSCGIDTVDGILRMGYRRSSDGTYETQEKVADRVGGIVAVWAALTVAQPLDQGLVNPLSSADGWKMLARLANTPKALLINLHFTVVSTWWDVGSERFKNQYGVQGIKLLKLLSGPWPVSVADKKYPAASKLMLQGEEWQKTGQLKSLKKMAR